MATLTNLFAIGSQQVQVQQQQITSQQSQSQLESQESLVQSQLADESDQVPHSSRKQKIKQVRILFSSLACISFYVPRFHCVKL